MQHIVFDSSDTYPIALLMKASTFSQQAIEVNYLKPLTELGIQKDEVIAYTLAYKGKKAPPVSAIKQYLESLLEALNSVGTKHLYVTDSAYFKVLSGARKAEPHLGYALPCVIKGYEHMSVVLGINYQQLIYKPDLIERLNMSLSTLASLHKGQYQEPGKGIIHSAYYPKTPYEIGAALQQLHQYPELSCDIETFSLLHTRAGIGTIAFAWNQHEGIAFACDYTDYYEDSVGFGSFVHNPNIRGMIKQFFLDYKGKLIFHRGNYDIKVLIFILWMKNNQDTEGLLEGLECLTRDIDDTLLIAYLATNTTSDNPLGLKYLAHEFAGNYAVEVRDISIVPLKELLQYNLIDALSTHYVRSKYYPIMVADQQEELYKGLFLDSLKLIIQLELTGMPMNWSRIASVQIELEGLRDKYLHEIETNPAIQLFNVLLQNSAWEDDFNNRKSKAKNPHKIQPKPKDAFKDVAFNPNSGPQLQRLLYELMGLPVIDLTDTKAPATGASTLKKLVHHTDSVSYKRLLEALIEYGGVTKLLSTFLPAFHGSVPSSKPSMTSWLYGSFNLGGTVSGRLSSSEPNLQNLPAGNSADESKAHLGKLIKSCFQAPKGWIFAGADFNSLEDYVSALTTKDPNKLAVYERAFDGHCLRAAYYFRDELPHIDLEDPKSVNTIKDTHPELRQTSKAPTFALTYRGTWLTLVNNLGWSEKKAKEVEAAYHEMYKVSDQYVDDRLRQATIDGFVTVAFGLRVRTPLLKQVIWGSPRMPHEAQAEGRTAGNALGQSYGLLNNRAAVAFFKKVWKSPYRTKILPIALIHDAIYLLIKDDLEVVEWANKHLIDEMKWQELPELQHDVVKLGANLDLFWPSWEHSITLPNDATQEEIKQIVSEKAATH